MTDCKYKIGGICYNSTSDIHLEVCNQQCCDRSNYTNKKIHKYNSKQCRKNTKQ